LYRALNRLIAALVLCVVFGGGSFSVIGADGAADEDDAIARSLAAMVRAGRTVISRAQDLINDPDIGDKRLDGKTVLAQTLRIYQEPSGVDPLIVDMSSRRGRLIRAQMDAIVEVLDAHQQSLNQRGVGFKGFIPATFAQLVNEAFNRRVGRDSEIKVTAPIERVRNRKSRPDEWEGMVIRDKLLAPGWPIGQVYAALAESRGRPAYRVAVPEYYDSSCLSCHGHPKGQIDVTGYPKEGANEGELGGVISITLYR
jgi:hypothetical protein